MLWDKANESTVDNDDYEATYKLINQPEDCTVFNQTVVICYAPPQDWNVLQAIKKKNLELRICVHRPSDSRMSMNSFKYEYLPHVPSNQGPAFEGPSGFVCGSCHLQQINSVRVTLPLAKPGWQRRKHDDKIEIPDQLKTSPMKKVDTVVKENKRPEDQVMDLSVSSGTKRKSTMSSTNMQHPKKKRITQHLLEASKQTIHVVTLPKRPIKVD